MPDVLPDEVVCCGCEKRGTCSALYGDKLWFAPPSGWVVTDTYPPGDDGLRWACSWACAVAFDESQGL